MTNNPDTWIAKGVHTMDPLLFTTYNLTKENN